ncbi:MAG: adenylate/guanylate cyclase domain-containing protein [Gemmatimonadota bacterium]|nr:MAG: adenylate/guanylate cyclase domain-containing protein [Gemmatimonadota bacterium]
MPSRPAHDPTQFVNSPRLSALAFWESAVAPPVVGCLIAFLGVVVAQDLGWLERVELAAYDTFVRSLGEAEPDERVTVVKITEQDLRDLDQWPLDDARLARAVRTLVDAGAVAVGVDLYRDLPVHPGSDELARVLLESPEVVVISLWPPELGTPPPPVLRGSDQVGTSNFVRDSDDRIRRAVHVIEEADGSRHYSLAHRVAKRWLAARSGSSEPMPAIDGAPEPLGDWAPARLSPTYGAYRWAPQAMAFGGGDGGRVYSAETYQTLIDFGRFPAFHNYRLTDVLGASEGSLDVDGRVVLIGNVARSVRDPAPTPIGILAGVDVQAQMTSQLLRLALGETRPIRPWSDRAEVVWLLLWTALGAVVVALIRPTWAVTSLGALGVLGVGLSARTALQAGVWIPSAAPAVGWLGGLGLTLALVRTRERRTRRILMQLFSRHLSPTVASEVWHRRREFLEGGRPKPARIPLTVLFADLKDYTAMTERSEPVELMEWINRLLGMMADEVMGHGGVVDSYLGDGIMGTFGVPVGSDGGPAKDALNAVRCAQAMATRVAELNRERGVAGLPPVAIRIGIKSGEAVVGSIGSKDRLKYTVIGDVVNTASRLEGFAGAPHDFAAEPARILVGRGTRDLVDGKVDLVDLGAHGIKGKREPVEVYKVIVG